MELVRGFSQPNTIHRSEVRAGVIPFWNTPGQASAFSSILSSPQHTTPASGSGVGSTRGSASSQDSTGAAQGVSPATNPPVGEVILSPNAGETPPRVTNIFATRQPSISLQGSGPASRGLFEPAPVQSLFGPPVKSRVGGLFGSALPSPQSQASLSRIVDSPPPYPSGPVRILPVGPPVNVQHPQTSPALPSPHQNEGVVLAEVRRGLSILLTHSTVIHL